MWESRAASVRGLVSIEHLLLHDLQILPPPSAAYPAETSLRDGAQLINANTCTCTCNRDIFIKWDLDQDGFIDATELRKGLSSLSLGIPQAHAHRQARTHARTHANRALRDESQHFTGTPVHTPIHAPTPHVHARIHALRAGRRLCCRLGA